MLRLCQPVTMMMSSMPLATASSTTYCMMGLSTTGSISLGWALVAGRKRVPMPAAGIMALRTFGMWVIMVNKKSHNGIYYTKIWGFYTNLVGSFMGEVIVSSLLWR